MDQIAGRTRDRAGFTLMEVLCAMVLFVLLLTMVVNSASTWSRSASRRTTLEKLRSSLVLARQWARLHGETISLAYGNSGTPPRGRYWLTTTSGERIGGTNYLAKGWVFSNAPTATLFFSGAGTCLCASNSVDLVVVERDRGAYAMSGRLRVFRTTGYVEKHEDR
jgi:prepilin-type N-terminal cleavage/methylation domain-containing protein